MHQHRSPEEKHMQHIFLAMRLAMLYFGFRFIGFIVCLVVEIAVNEKSPSAIAEGLSVVMMVTSICTNEAPFSEAAHTFTHLVVVLVHCCFVWCKCKIVFLKVPNIFSE
jgi:hypothetical protein